jgi:AcrR family transcriptional regulator
MAGGKAGQRSRRNSILEAMIQVAGRDGYRGATVSETVAEAGVARTTFYKHFADRHGCFVAAYELAAERTLESVEAGCDREMCWSNRMRAGLASLVELLAGDPRLARVLVVVAAASGSDGRCRQLALLERCAELIGNDGGTEGSRGSGDFPETAAAMAAGAVAGLLFEEVQAGRAAALQRRMPDFLFALFVPFLGPRRAAEKAQSRSPTPLRGRERAGARPAGARDPATARRRR